MKNLQEIRLSDFHYELPEERIAQKPLNQRDQSQLLQYRSGQISHHIFTELPALLPQNSLLVFNDTRVIQARLFFRRTTGALIEVLLLTPTQPSEVQQAMQASGVCEWKCMIGRKKRWKAGEVLRREFEVQGTNCQLEVELIDRAENIVRFRWDQPALTWAQLVEVLGKLPLPPYINREATEADLEQYQTVYARHEGAVAAPTAGLHFTETVLHGLAERGVGADYLTLHVSAGTFLPVKQDQVVAHDMHMEQFIVSRSTLENLLADEHRIVAVGTTSMRTLESLFWMGHQLLQNPNPEDQTLPLQLDQHYPYRWETANLPSLRSCLQALLNFLEKKQLPQLVGETKIIIMPGYPFQVCQGLITNYHMPETTLILLVAAFVGEDWRRIYETALQENYRFLSYGDSSLLWRKTTANA
jgi:S-adenosylmethionine:tRNA ribosyltransferase-isomerase